MKKITEKQNIRQMLVALEELNKAYQKYINIKKRLFSRFHTILDLPPTKFDKGLKTKSITIYLTEENHEKIKQLFKSRGGSELLKKRAFITKLFNDFLKKTNV